MCIDIDTRLRVLMAVKRMCIVCGTLTNGPRCPDHGGNRRGALPVAPRQLLREEE